MSSICYTAAEVRGGSSPSYSESFCFNKSNERRDLDMPGFLNLPWSTGIGYLIGFIVLILGIIYALVKGKEV